MLSAFFMPTVKQLIQIGFKTLYLVCLFCSNLFAMGRYKIHPDMNQE